MSQKVPTKERIFEAAVHLFATKGYHGTSIRDIAKSVGIKESSMYNHFAGKEALFQSILDYQIDGFNQSIKALERLKEIGIETEDPVEFWFAGTREFLKDQPPHSEEISIIILNEMFLNETCRDFVLNKLYMAQKDLVVTLLTAMQEMNLIRSCDIERVAQQYICMIHGLEIENKLKTLQGIPREETMHQLMDQMAFFFEPLRIES